MFSRILICVLLAALAVSAAGCGSTTTSTTTRADAPASPADCLRGAAFGGITKTGGREWRGDYPDPFFALFIDRLGSHAAAASATGEAVGSVRMTAGRYSLVGPANRGGGSTLSDKQLLEAKIAMQWVASCLNGD